jgi:hypothetical protein
MSDLRSEAMSEISTYLMTMGTRPELLIIPHLSVRIEVIVSLPLR